MSDALRLYSRYIGVSLRSQIQYRASFIMQTFGQLLITFLDFLAIWVLFNRFANLGGWSLAEVAFLYGMVQIEWSLADAAGRGFDVFGDMVKSGEFDRVLLRPRSTVLQLAGQELTLRRVGRFSQGAAVFGWALASLDIAWSPAKAALFLAAVFGGSCLFYGLLVFQATLCFWTTETIEIMNIFTYGGCEAARYPIHIYGRWFQKFFTFVVPTACVTYFPAVVILGKPDRVGLPPWFHWASPALGAMFLAAALLVWRFGVRHYQSTGS